MIIGIGGSSNSGKSSFANELANYYNAKKINAKVLCQDDFVLMRDELTKINNHADWEKPSTIKIEEYILAVKDANRNNNIVLCEGLFAFWFDELNVLYDKTVFLSIDKKTFVKRKKIDFRWGKEPDWYINHIWENHLKYGQYKLSKDNFLLLDATTNIRISEVVEFIQLGM